MTRAARVFANLLLVAVLALAAVVIRDHGKSRPEDPLAPLEGRIDRILIEKGARRLTVFRNGAPLRSYKIALGFAAEGDKLRQGDGRTPEGLFRIDRRNAASAYHLSLGIDYPQANDVARARAAGVSPGGDIFIHGQPNGYDAFATLPYDWTAGCIALSDAAIEDLWRVAAIGTPVEIRP